MKPASAVVLGWDGLVDVPPHQGVVERSGQAQGPGERSPTLGEVEAGGRGVDVRPSAGLPCLGVGEQDSIDGDQAQQVGLDGRDPAPDTRADGTRRTHRRSDVVESTASGQASSPPFTAAVSAAVACSSATGAASERMSMRQPVSRAASRAFWPSLPMARESW